MPPYASDRQPLFKHITEVEKGYRNKQEMYRYHCLLCNKRGKYQKWPEGTTRGANQHMRIANDMGPLGHENPFEIDR